MNKIAVFGASLNPPGVHHKDIVEILSREGFQVVVVPCGPRPDKVVTNDLEPNHRAAMADMTFSGIPNVRVDLFDLDKDVFTRTHELDDIYNKEGEVWHVVGTDLVRGGATGESDIQKKWKLGKELWNRLNFLVFQRDGYECLEQDLPPNRIVYRCQSGSSFEIRERVFKHQSIEGLVVPRVNDYIERYSLYCGKLPVASAIYNIKGERPFVINEIKGEAVADSNGSNASYIMVSGGDGTMLRAIRKYWRMRLPFFGVNKGHLGFLMNSTPAKMPDSFNVYLLPLLHVEVLTNEGWKSFLAFNDAWVERASGQTAWVSVAINSKVKLPKVECDGILVATPAGSTAYSKAMGARPLLLDEKALILTGSNVLRPSGWRSTPLSFNSEVSFKILDSGKRPVYAFADSVFLGEAREMKVRVSRMASVELAFVPGHDFAKKFEELLFT